MFLSLEIPSWLADFPLNSTQLLLAGGGLLLLAALLLLARRPTKVYLQRSLLSDEVIIYLGRIAEALERRTGPSTDEVADAVIRRIDERARGQLGEKVGEKKHTVPFSMFAREYTEKR